jgi:tryptophan synthase alpha chain
MTRIADAFARARREGRAAFIAYLTAGDPSPDATVGLARAVDRAGADILELGVPFSDPIADGPVLQRSAARALARGTTLRDVFSIARRIREETPLALILFSYVNPILRFGVEAAAQEARQAGFDGALLTDMPPEEARGLHPQLRGAGLDTILLVSPTSPERRMRDAARLSSGFLYVVSRAGTTGARRNLPRELPQTVRRARRAAGSLPVAVGFGISTPETARQAARIADGIVVGSALMLAAEREGPGCERGVERVVRALVAACGRSRSAAK